MKKRILTAIVFTVIFALALFTVACSADDITLKVTVKYNAEQGSIAVTDADGGKKTEFVAGAKVVVTVTANEGYAVEDFTVNGVAAELKDGVYGFVISANTVVEATFKKTDDGNDPDDDPDDGKTPEERFAEAYDSVKTTFMAVGSYTYTEDGEDPYTNNITTVFGNGAVNIIETDGETGEILYDTVYVNKDGKIAQPYRTIDNKIDYQYPDDEETYSDYDNPFKTLTTADFAVTETKNVFKLTSKDKAKTAAIAITGWVESIASFTVTIGGGKVTKINIATERIQSGTGEDVYYYTSVYSFTLSEWGTADVDDEAVTPYKTTAAHTALKNALQAASEAKNYTLHIYEQEAGYEDLEYDVYVTETAIYDACEGWQAGYVEMNLTPDDEDGMLVYPFRIGAEKDGPEKDGKVVLSDAVDYPTVKAMRASFDGFAPEIFYADGDSYALQNDCLGYVRDVLVHFADGADNIMLYGNYAAGLQITLKDGKLFQVEMLYYVYGSLVRRVITYSAWDSTVMPIEFDDYVKESIFDDYLGTYTDNNSIVVKITLDGITVNNRPIDDLAYSSLNQMFTGTYNGMECSIIYMSAKQLAVVIGLNSYVVTNTDIGDVDVPEAFNGVWTDGQNTVTVAYDKVMFGSNMLKVLSYDEDEGLVAVRGNVTYRFMLGELQGDTALSVRTLTSGMTAQTYTMSKEQNGFIIPETFVGTYAALRDMTDYKVVVTLNGVTVKMDSVQKVATDVAVADDELMGAVLTFKLDGESYIISKNQYGDGIFLEGKNANKVSLPKGEDDDPMTPPTLKVDIPEAFYGEYMYLNPSANEYYYLSIDGDGIVALIDMSSNEYTAEILEFNEEDDFMITVSINGQTFYLFGSVDNMTDDGKYNIITLMNDKTGDDGIEVELLRDGYKKPDDGGNTPVFNVPANFIGVYEGTKNGDDSGTKYVLTVTATGMTLKIGDAEPIDVKIKGYESTAARTRFTVIIAGMGNVTINSGVNLSEIGDTLIQNLYIMGEGIVSLTRVTQTSDNA